jgi:two-component system phosphate regulon response regulator PhoB
MEIAIKGKPMVLVMDDEEDLLFLVELTLKQEGFKTEISPNAADMMDIIAQTHPDIIVLDIHMRGIDGGTVCQLIKSNTSTADIPVILFSANENIANISRQCGADGYITKPFTGEKFKDTFLTILNKRDKKNHH